jgi:autophagy-related protein 9
MSYPFAARYVDQFPKDKTVQLSRFVAFITGALAAVLALASVVDPELFLGFEITHERTVLFYLGVFGTVWAVARGAVPEETLVFDPEFALNNVVEYTHYLPAHWRGRLHSDDVRKEFSLLYQMKVVIFLEEILSLIFTPFILWFSLPKCSERIVDFFREFTIHVDGLGYVCSFAVFDFKRAADGGAHLRPRHAQGQAAGLREDYYSTKDGKMLASFYGFLDNYSSAPRQAGGASRIQTGSRRPPPQPRTSNEFHAAGVSPRQRAYQVSARSVLAASTMQAAKRPGPVPRTGLGGAELSSAAQASRFPVPHLAASNLAGPSRQRVQHRQRPSESRPARAYVQGAEAEPASLTTQPGGGGVASSGSAEGTEDEGHLGESWKTTRAATVGGADEGDEGHIDGLAGDKEVGVLGLLYQFQRAQVEGRGGGVVI